MSEKKDSLNRGGFYAFLFSFSFSILFCFYLGFVYEGIDLKEVPKEAFNSGAGAKGSLPERSESFDVAQVAEPWKTTSEMVDYGKKVYTINCAVCHGKEGRGDGVAGKSLVPRPRDLVRGKWEQGGDSISLYKSITNGVPGGSMAAFSHLPKTDRWALVHFIQDITNEKAKDDVEKLEAFAKTAE